MNHRIGRPLILTALAALTSACVIDANGSDFDDVDAVRANAALAIEQCGQGNVGAVDTEGFTCKKAGE